MLATLAKSTPVLADDTPVWVTTDAAGNQLAWAHWENTYSGYTRVERATEWQLIHQMYQNDPTLPPADVQKQVVALRATMEAISQSPESEFLNTTQTQLKMLDALSGVFLSNPPGVVGLAVVKAANLLMDTIQQGEKDKISTQNAYLTTVDQASRAAAVEDKQKAIFDSVRTSTNPYEVAAVNGLYLPELNISLHADADAIIGADPQVRSTMETLDAIDASTKKLSTEIHDGVQSIRLDISNLNSAWDQKWTETQDELHNINGSISDLNSKIDAQGKSFADYVADERGRQAEADARVREAQQFQQTIKGLQASISIISTFVGMVNPAAGKAIRAVGTAALSIGVSIATWLGAVGSLASLASPLGLLNTVTMVGGVMGAVQGLFGAFSNAPSELDIVSSKLDGLKQQVSDLQANMNQRFDRLNQTLGQIFEGMNVQFQRLNHQLVSVAADVQLALGKFAGLELELAGVDNAIRQFATAEATSRVQDMIGSVINYSQNHPGSLLPHDRYTQATDLFTTFGIVDAVSDPRLVGESGRSTDPRHVAQELSQPLEGNLQYLSSLITLRTGLTALGPQPMNPRAWAWAAQALSLLYQQSADYARQDDNGHGSTKELDEFIQAGQNFESETAALGKDTATMNALLDQYAADAAALVGVDGAGAYSSDSTIESLHDLQARELHTLIPNLADGGATGSTLLWGPSTQQLGPPDVPIAPIIPNVGCGSSGKWSGAAPYALRWPGASSLAVKLQLADVQMCLSGDWVNTVANPDGFETGNLEYSLSISEALKAGTSQPTWKVVAWSSYVDPAEISICYTVDYDNENTRRCKNPETQAVLRFGDVAQELLYRQHLMPGASELSNVTTKVQSDLRNSYYGYMTARLASSSAGADVQDLLDKIKVVAGDKALIRATLQVIMPRALDSDDYLASLILGPTFVNDPLGPTGLNADGSILGDEAATIGDWLDGTQTAAAPETVLMTINDHNSRHVQALRAVVSSYQTKLASGAYVESLPVVSETLTTLDVAKHVVFSRVQGRMPASTSSDGIQRVLSHALYHQKLYADLGNRCSIGYDHVVHSGPCTGQEPAEFRDGISQSRADGLARQDIQTSEEALHSTVTVCLDKHQFDALVDFVFNVGPTYLASRGASEWKVLRLLNAGDLAGTTQAIAEWRFVNGRENSVLAAQRADDVQEFDRGETPC